MDKRPLPQSTRDWLLDQMKIWQSGGIVSDDQANAILDLYETPTQSAARRQSVAIYILVGVAAFFVGLAALLIVSLSWDKLPDPLKMFVLLAAVTGTHGFGFYVRYVWEAKTFSEFAFFLGSLFYGGAIMLIANIFNMHENPASGFFWWGLPVLLLALFLDTVLMHLLAVGLLATWVGLEMISQRGHDWGLILGNVTHGCWTLPILGGLGLVWCYQRKSPTTLGLYVPLLAWWLVLLPLVLTPDHMQLNPIFFIGGVGALLLVAAEVHQEGSRLAIPYRLYGAVVCVGVLIFLSFHWTHRDLVRGNENVGLFVAQSVAITLVSAGVFAIAFMIQSERAGSIEVRSLSAYIARQWLPLAMAGLMLAMTLWYAALHGARQGMEDFTVLVPTVLSNVGLIGLAFWLMMLGLREDRGFPAAGGVVFFLVWTVCRYGEWFHTDVLGAACMFFFCGAAIFGFAMYWHQRKKQRERGSHEFERE